jgi:hypothetical protein
MLLLLTVALAHAAPWGAFGEPPPGHRLVSETAGPDLVRSEWESPGVGRYWIDLPPDKGGNAFCRGGGLVLQVRRTLGDEPESFVLDPIPAPVSQACEGLGTAAAPLVLVQMAALQVVENAPGPDGAPVDPAAPVRAQRLALFAPRAMHAVVLAAALTALVVAATTRPRAWLQALPLFALALALRLAASTPTALLGGDAAYERLVSALGRGQVDHYYGEAWKSALGLVYEARQLLGFGGPPTDFVHDVNLLLSSLAPVFLAGIAIRLGLPRAFSLAAGVALAVFPQAVSLAQVEDHAPAVATLQLLTAWAALGSTRSQALLAALSAGLLAHLRPEQLPVAVVLLLPLLRTQRVIFGLGLALVLSRLAYLPEISRSPIDFGRLLDPSQLPPLLRSFTAPSGLPGLAALGIAGLGLAAGAPRWRSLPRMWGWAALVFLATTLPYLPKTQPAGDPLRFSLPAVAWLLLLVAGCLPILVHAARTDARRAGLRAVGLFGGLAVLAVLLPKHPVQSFPRPWAWEEEYRFLREHLPAENGEATSGWYDASQDPNGAFALWMQLRTGMTWRAWGSGHPQPGDLVYRGTADRLSGSWAGATCGLDPREEEHVAPLSDGWVDFGPEPVTLAFYTVRDCPRP